MDAHRFAGLPQHVTLSGAPSRTLFASRGDYIRLLWTLDDALRARGTLLHGLVLLPSQVHLIVLAADASAPATVARELAGAYSAYKRRTGTRRGLFYGEATRLPLDRPSRLAGSLAFVDLAPCAAGLVRTAADYPWSTHRLHAAPLARSEVPRGLWTPCGWYVQLGPTREARAAAYSAWVGRCAGRMADRVVGGSGHAAHLPRAPGA